MVGKRSRLFAIHRRALARRAPQRRHASSRGFLRYHTRIIDLRIGEHDYRIRALKDLQQFHDPDQAAQRLGISSAMWSLFGQLWPTGLQLAREIAVRDVAGKRILELGCGLALSSLILHKRDADITASDRHPLTEDFLAQNSALNGLSGVPYNHLEWAARRDLSLGGFDLIIGSDVLYERGHAALLANVVKLYAHPHAEVLIADPGRGHCGAMNTAMRADGFTSSERRFSIEDRPALSGRMMRFRR